MAELEEKIVRCTQELEAVNKDFEAFAYSVSHDLKAPLRAINGFTDILVKKYGDKIDDQGKELIGVIIANAKKMGQLIEDLLQFSRIGRKDLEVGECSMEEVVQKVITEAKNLNSGRKIEVTVEQLPPAKGDKNLLERVWESLISNAIKYSREKPETKITIGGSKADNEVIYFIKDNGAGFDMKYKDNLFKAFQRLHGSEFEGTGLGLANISRIITKHGGRVWAEGKVDEGATFYFSLPV